MWGMKSFLFLINLIILIGFVGISYFLFSLGSVSEVFSAKEFEIKNGQGLAEITSNLKTAGLIRSKNVFKVYAVVSGSAHILKPGDYVLNSASGTPTIVNVLVQGPKKEVTVVIVEGMSLRDIEEVLSAEDILPAKVIFEFNFDGLKKDYDFLASVDNLEGYLFPDTYRFFKKSSVELVIRKFLDNFKQKAWPILKKDADFQEKLILASLIEKEVPSSEDRQIVSGVLQKRLALGIPLQVDATLSYIKCSGTFVFCDKPAVARKDLSLVSLYNTYLHRGLPPGSISNPGLAAIQAALNPRKSDYLYYLSDPKTKKTIFSKTLEEHNDNRSKYLGI